MQNIILGIEGMTCSSCSNGLEKYLNKQNGIINANVNLVMANATIDFDETILDKEKLEKYIKQAGFTSTGVFKEFKIEKKNKTEKVQFIIFTILAIILMYISMGHMVNLPIPKFLNPHDNTIIYTITLLILTISFLCYGYDILKNGFKNLTHGIPNMDTLVMIGVLSSFIYSLYRMYEIIQGNYSYIMDLYFESSAIVIYFIKLGRYLDGISKDKTKEAINKLVQITPNQAVIEIGEEERKVTLDEIKKGMIVICRPGEKIAVDGTIVEGKAHLDESFITGESKPAQKVIGQTVIAGSINYDGFIKYRAERIGKESTISEIVRAVLEASNTKAPIAKITDKISGFFVPVVIVIAILTFITYLLLGFGISTSIITFVTVLVVACPCSLGLATPLAIIVSEGLCASNGILVKKSEILENASKVDTIVFDKTGTLTYGKLKIANIYSYTNLSEIELMKLVGSLESKSSHPIARAFTDYLEKNKIEKLEIKNFKDISGYGISGEIEEDSNDIKNHNEKKEKSKIKQSVKLLVGNRKLVEKENIKNPYEKDEKVLTKVGNSILYVIKNKEIIALIGVNDMIRDNAKEVIQKINNRKIQTIMLTGDNLNTANTIAEELGITKVIANVLPAQKAQKIKQLKNEGYYVMMCGDGINDSPALANSDISISIQSGTDIAIDSSEVILTQNDLNSILKLITISEKTIITIKQNLFWAFFYNLLMIPIAMGLLKPFGIAINPMIASFAMVFSSLTVILNTLRLKKVSKKVSNNYFKV